MNLIERERKKVKYLHFAKKTSKKFTKLNLNYIFVYALREKKNRLNLAVKKNLNLSLQKKYLIIYIILSFL